MYDTPTTKANQDERTKNITTLLDKCKKVENISSYIDKFNSNKKDMEIVVAPEYIGIAKECFTSNGYLLPIYPTKTTIISYDVYITKSSLDEKQIKDINTSFNEDVSYTQNLGFRVRTKSYSYSSYSRSLSHILENINICLDKDYFDDEFDTSKIASLSKELLVAITNESEKNQDTLTTKNIGVSASSSSTTPFIFNNYNLLHNSSNIPLTNSMSNEISNNEFVENNMEQIESGVTSNQTNEKNNDENQKNENEIVSDKDAIEQLQTSSEELANHIVGNLYFIVILLLTAFVFLILISILFHY